MEGDTRRGLRLVPLCDEEPSRLSDKNVSNIEKASREVRVGEHYFMVATRNPAFGMTPDEEARYAAKASYASNSWGLDHFVRFHGMSPEEVDEFTSDQHHDDHINGDIRLWAPHRPGEGGPVPHIHIASADEYMKPLESVKNALRLLSDDSESPALTALLLIENLLIALAAHWGR